MRKWKKLISFMLIMCMLSGVIFCEGEKQVAHAEDNPAESTQSTEKELSAISFDTFGLTDGTAYSQTSITPQGALKYWKNDTGAYKDAIFSGRFETDGTTGSLIIFGGSANARGDGLRVSIPADGSYMSFDTEFLTDVTADRWTKKIQASSVGMKSFHDGEVKLSIAFECVDTDDLKLTVYINDKLVPLEGQDSWIIQNTYSETVTNKLGYTCASTLSNRIQFEEGALTVYSCKPEGYLKEVTFVDFGFKDATYGTECGTWYPGIYPGSMKNVMVKGNVTYEETCGSTIRIGTTKATGADEVINDKNEAFLSGLMFHDAEGGFCVLPNLIGKCLNVNGDTYQSTDTDCLAAVNSADGFELSVTTEIWDYDGDGKKTDGKAEVRVNGVLFNGMYFILENMFDDTADSNGLVVFTDNWGPGAYITAASKAEIPQNLKKLNASDFGWESNVTKEGQAATLWINTKQPDSILNTVLQTRVNVTHQVAEEEKQYAPYDAIWLRYASLAGESATDTEYGLAMRIQNDGKTISILSGAVQETLNNSWATGKFTISAEQVTESGSFLDEAFDLAIVTTREDLDGDNVYDDAGFGLWINDHFCGRFFVKDYVSKNYTNEWHVVFAPNWVGKAEVTLSDIEARTDAFASLYLDNMSGGNTEAGVYGWGEDLTNPEAIEIQYPDTVPAQYTNMDGVYFSSNVRFSKGNVYLYYGGNASKKSGWWALYLRAIDESKSKLILNYPLDASNTFQMDLKETIAGVQLYDKTFKLGISTRNVDSDGDGYFDDLQVGVWFDDKLYNNQYLYFTDKADALESNLTVYSEGAGQIVIGDYTQQQATPKVYCADACAYIISGDTVTVGENTYNGGHVLSSPGVYNVSYTDKNSTFKENVTVYMTDDINGSGNVDVVDLVGLLKYNANEKELDVVGEYAMGIKDNTYNFAVRKASVYSRLLADENTIGAKTFSDEIIGATGSNTYIAATGMTQEGTAVLNISDSADNRTYHTDMAAFNGSGLDYILDFDADREIKVLQLTDPQIIDSAQKRSADRIDASSTAAWAPENMNTVLFDEMDRLIAAQKPDLILVTGDIIYGEFDDAGTSLDAFITKMESYKIPWAPVFGNHDNESLIGVTEQCNRFVNANYCLFTRRHEIGGNGNYAIGIAVKGTLQRTIFMMDSNGCYNIPEADRDIVSTGNQLFDTQIAWYQSVAAKSNVPSFMCFHISPPDTNKAIVEKGLQDTYDTDNYYADYDLGDEGSGQEAFGLKQGQIGDTLNKYLYSYLKTSGTDGVFLGHLHLVSISVEWQGIRWTFGRKTGCYDQYPTRNGTKATGGTLITLNGADFEVQYVTDTQ